ncbi:MAG: 4-carboxy-4-hydroxy-2-oxoadipate aldolase/oxaloacetate decarboxylase [Chloroflexi bacterium]|nr:4-carboxy-4-hydroxy-2-oxoadipate aldolase/oxaloacetate decarboxylase [Chloroflexota bacterium]
MPEAVLRHVPRVSPELLAAYADQEAATVYEAAGACGGMDHTIRPIAWGQRMVGSALTVRCHPADNLMLHAAIAIARPGDVIVADVGGLLDAGYWGEITTVAAMARGVVGLVINGGIRDRGPISELGFPIWSAAICMRATVKRTAGAINYPVVVGGVTVHPGDLVLGDDDGVVVVARERAAEVLATAKARASKEADVMERLRAGELTLDLLGFRRTLEGLGIHLRHET